MNTIDTLVEETKELNELKEIWKAIREIRQHLPEDSFKVIIPCDIDEGGYKLS